MGFFCSKILNISLVEINKLLPTLTKVQMFLNVLNVFEMQNVFEQSHSGSSL